MAWAPDGDRLATAGGDNEVQIWDATAAGADAAPRRRPGWIRAVAVSRDGGRVATLGGEQGGTSTSPVHVCEVVDGLAITATAPTTGGDQALAWSADGRFLRIAGAEPRRWEHTTGLTTQLAGWLNDSRPAPLGKCAWAPDGTRLAVVDLDRIRLWDADDPA